MLRDPVFRFDLLLNNNIHACIEDNNTIRIYYNLHVNRARVMRVMRIHRKSQAL